MAGRGSSRYRVAVVLSLESVFVEEVSRMGHERMRPIPFRLCRILGDGGH